jgi:hypothetical protein
MTETCLALMTAREMPLGLVVAQAVAVGVAGAGALEAGGEGERRGGRGAGGHLAQLVLEAGRRRAQAGLC